MPEDFYNFAKVAKNRQILSHWQEVSRYCRAQGFLICIFLEQGISEKSKQRREFFYNKIQPFPASFFFMFVLSTEFFNTAVSKNIADDWIRTADLWYRKQRLYLLRHNHCPWTESLYCVEGKLPT